uniref:Uncharacterized protein n=1 Tax=Setaria italica TaxID=4555 RepID=K4AG78_SETIT
MEPCRLPCHKCVSPPNTRERPAPSEASNSSAELQGAPRTRAPCQRREDTARVFVQLLRRLRGCHTTTSIEQETARVLPEREGGWKEEEDEEQRRSLPCRLLHGECGLYNGASKPGQGQVMRIRAVRSGWSRDRARHGRLAASMRATPPAGKYPP